jgi:hypothetical protein
MLLLIHQLTTKAEVFMKKLISILITLTLIISLFSTTAIEAKGSEMVPFIEFASLEDFLNAYLIYKDGGCIEIFIDRGALIDEIDLTELEIFHLPLSIPEGFAVRRIRVTENSVSFHFLPENVEVTRIAWLDNPHIELSMSWRFTMEAVMRQRRQTIDDLIDGKYTFYHIANSFISFDWEYDGMLLGLAINLNQQHTEEFKALFGDGDPIDFVKFAETATVDLTDDEDIRVLLSGEGVRFRRGDVSGTGVVTTSDALEILKFSVGLPSVLDNNERARNAADVNGDGKIDAADALEVLRIVVGL